MNLLATLFISVLLSLAGLWPPCARAEASRWADLAHTAFHKLRAGLPHPVVASLAEDGDGFLWLGTQAGLARWDGYHFHLYPASDLPDQWVQVLHTDLQGRLWVGTRGAALARFDKAQDRFIAMAGGPNRHALWAMADADRDHLWLGGDDGLALFNSQTGRLQNWPLTDPPRTTSGLAAHSARHPAPPAPRVRTLLRDRVGELWIGTDVGLLRRASHAGPAILQTIRLPLANGQTPAITSLFQAQDGKIWIGTQQHGAWLLEPRTGEISALQKNIALGIDTIYAIVQANTDEIWLGSFGQGIIAVNTLSLEARRIVHHPGLADSLPDNTVWSMLRDRAGLLWIGTGAGLARHNGANQAIFSLKSQGDAGDGLANGGVSAILADFDGQVWLGHDKNGISVIDARAQHIRALRPDPRHPAQTLPRVPIEALLQDGNGDILAASRRGLFQIHGERVAQLTWPQPNRNAIVSALHARKQELWLGLWDGLRIRKRAGDKLLTIPEETSRLSDKRITAIESAGDGALWIGTGSGLNWYQPESKRVLAMRASPGDPHGLASGNITSLLLDRNQRLWIGTQGGGLHLLESEPGQLPARFRRFGSAQGLPGANVQKLLQDPYGNIWASCDEQIVRIDGKTLHLRRLDGDDGVHLGAYLPGAGAATRQGELLFGSSNGLTVVHSHAFHDWHYRPPVVITQITVQGKPVPAAQYNRQLARGPDPAMAAPARNEAGQGQPGPNESGQSHSGQNASNPNESGPALRILPQANQFSVEFAALDYSSPQNNRYAWRLAGYDQDWIESDAEHRQAVYTNLPPGEYQLHLRGSNRIGLWSENVLPIQVLPAWYQSWWFRVLFCVLLGGAFLALLQGRTAYLRRSKRQLEAQVAERTAQLQESNQHLSRANDELAFSADTLRELSDVGREITANLDLGIAFDSLQRHVATMLGAPALAIYRLSGSGQELVQHFAREHGQMLETMPIPIDSQDSKAAEAARLRHEILLELTPDSPNPWHQSGTAPMLTSLYAPLTIDERLLGVMSVHAERQHAFGQRERLIFRTLCAYSAIALDNGNAYTQLKQAQEKLVAQEKLAALGGLVAGVAHELNTPLGNSIMMTSAWQDHLTTLKTRFAEGVLQSRELAEYLQDAEDAGHIIMRGLQTAAKLITSFKQVAVDRASAQQRRFNLAQTSRELIATLSHPPQFTIELAIPEAIELNSYPGPYGQVLEQLIGNAMLHGFEGCARGTIRITARHIDHGWVRIDCSDDGNGIAPEHLKQLFDPFFTTKTGQGSTGLGLSICYNTVSALLGGQISVSSQLASAQQTGGTTFSLILPLVVGSGNA
jgi:ligand-binding sensor domain-containing protein/signal transduction histidine kinase